MKKEAVARFEFSARIWDIETEKKTRKPFRTTGLWTELPIQKLK